MTKSILNKVATPLRALREDERGAESSEVILVLVLLVIGLMGAWAFLKGKIAGAASRGGNCLGSADTATKC